MASSLQVSPPEAPRGDRPLPTTGTGKAAPGRDAFSLDARYTRREAPGPKGVPFDLGLNEPPIGYDQRVSGARPDPDAAQRAELAAFLKARRALLQPEDVGLAVLPGRRRAPGLRREEVVELSGVGLTWYTWLEQGRPVTISQDVVEALGHGLRLDAEAHEHLRGLAGFPAVEAGQLVDHARPELARLLDTVMPAPACIFDQRFDFVAWNDTFAAIWDPAALPQDRHNVMWLAFADPAHRQVWVNWEERSWTLLAEFRAAAARHPGDARFAELIAALSATSSEFRSWWTQYEVKHSITGPLKIRLQSVGTINFDVIDLRVSGAEGITLSAHVPARPSDHRKTASLLTASPKQLRVLRGRRPTPAPRAQR